MAFQRPFLISLKRSEPNEPWGFRVFGGRDYEEPHVVQTVASDSIAERSGLRQGDEIIQVGRVNIQDLTFNQVQELIARCGNRVEMFIIREDLLSKTGKEPPCIKAVVHNPYNSPLPLYSTENIADALAKQTEVLTDGRISSAEEEEAPENLSFKQKSAVFQLLEEQAKQESATSQTHSRPRGSPQRKVPPPPPPKPKPPAQVNHHYEEVQSPRSPQRHTTTAVITPTQLVQETQPLSNQTATLSFKITSKAYNTPPTADHYSQSTTQTSASKVGPPPPPRVSSQSQATMATVQRQQQQYHYQTQYQYPQQEQQSYYPQHQQVDYQQVRRQQEVYQTAPQYQQPQYQQQQYQQQPQYQQQQPQYQQQPKSQYQPQPQYQQQERDPIFESVATSNTPITYKAPPPQRCHVAWPPPNDTLRQMTPSPTPQSPSKMPVSSVWPPRQPTVKELPRSGFNPAVLREQGTGRKCIWPPPKSEDEMRSGRTTPQSPVGGRRVNWNPSPSPPTIRRSPFGSTSPQTRRKDISWPPPQPMANKENFSRPSPRLSRKSGRFEDHVKQHASSNVPTTYRPPPGTQFRPT